MFFSSSKVNIIINVSFYRKLYGICRNNMRVTIMYFKYNIFLETEQNDISIDFTMIYIFFASRVTNRKITHVINFDGGSW